MPGFNEVDGFRIGERVAYDPDIALSGRRTETGVIRDFRIGVHANYAKVVPDAGNVSFHTIPVHRLHKIGGTAA
jgi:hypothetical protein